MSARSLALVLVGLATLAQQTAAAQPTAVSVRATDPIIVKEDRFQFVDFLLTNDSPLAITAWGVMYKVTRSDGTTRDEGRGKDVYKSYERGCDTEELSSCFVQPRQARRVRFIASSKEDYVAVTLNWSSRSSPMARALATNGGVPISSSTGLPSRADGIRC